MSLHFDYCYSCLSLSYVAHLLQLYPLVTYPRTLILIYNLNHNGIAYAPLLSVPPAMSEL